MGSGKLAEIQGPYGPLIIPEQVVQQVWHESKFLPDRLITESGRKLEVVNPGEWNKAEGPDFLNARLLLDGEPVDGDVEIHFNGQDWRYHGHDRDARFERVVLHVVLFPGKTKAVTSAGKIPETLVLLPHLMMDLEQCMLDFRLTRIDSSGGFPVVGLLADFKGETMIWRLADAAYLRWTSKVSAFQKRLSDTDWESTCHQTLLECFGGRRNRAVFGRIALEFPLEAMRSNRLTPEQLFKSQLGDWRLASMRPANHPRSLLSFYTQLVEEYPRWPDSLRHLPIKVGTKPLDPFQTAKYRRLWLREMAENLREKVFVRLPPGRVDTIVADMALPILSADRGDDFYSHWYHWKPGSFPMSLAQTLRQQSAERGLRLPLCNGLQQGLLQLIYEERN